MKEDNSVYMCMSCGNCKRSNESNSTLFKFTCACGDFIIDASFAARLEFIGCRSWMPANDNFNEPYFIKLDEKRRTIEIGKFGKKFIGVGDDIFDDLANTDSYSEMIDVCKEEYGEAV